MRFVIFIIFVLLFAPTCLSAQIYVSVYTYTCTSFYFFFFYFLFVYVLREFHRNAHLVFQNCTVMNRNKNIFSTQCENRNKGKKDEREIEKINKLI